MIFGNFYKKQAQMLLEFSERVSGAIISAYKNRVYKDGPLFVPFGENHNIGTHVLAQTLVQQNLRNQHYKIAYGMEVYDTTLLKIFNDYTDKKNIVPFSAFPLEDDNGLLAITALIAYRTNIYSKHSNRLLQNHLQNATGGKNPIAVSFNDFDVTKSLNKTLDPYSTEGVKVRNTYRVQNAIAHAKKLGDIDIYLESCGRTHVVGEIPNYLSKNEIFQPFEDTLTTQFTKAGQNVFAVPMYKGYLSLFSFPQAATQSENVMKYTLLRGPDFNTYKLPDDQKIAVEKREIEWLDNILPYLPLDQGLHGNAGPAYKKIIDNLFGRALSRFFPA